MKPRWTREFNEQTGPPKPPDVFRGTLFIGDESAPEAVLVQACIGEYSRGETVTREGGSYYLQVPQEGIHPDDIGQTVTFWVSQVKCEEEAKIDGNFFDTGARTLDLHVGNAAVPSEGLQVEIEAFDVNLVELDGTLAQVFLKWGELKTKLAQGELESPFYPPHKVAHKLWPGSVNYLGEFVTPYAAAVQDKAATIRDKQGEALIEAAFRCVYQGAIQYVADASVYGFDRWQLPCETLAKCTGDCEDKAALFTSILIASGWSREDVFSAGWQVNGAGHEWALVRLGDVWYVVECTANEWHGLMTYEDFKAIGIEYVETVRFNDKVVIEAS